MISLEKRIVRYLCEGEIIKLFLPSKIKKTIIILFFIFVLLLNGKELFAQVPENKEEPSRVLRQYSGYRGMNGSTFGLGIFKDYLQNRTSARYAASDFGIQFSFDQKIKDMFSGGLVFRWSHWTAQEDAENTPAEAAPIAFFSRIEMTPPLNSVASSSISEVIRPFLTAGLGTVTFMSRRGIPLEKAKKESTEPAVTFGLGLRIVVPGAAAFRFSAEKWRGVRTFRYTAWGAYFEVQFGDVAR